jgi:hypothetical protein
MDCSNTNGCQQHFQSTHGHPERKQATLAYYSLQETTKMLGHPLLGIEFDYCHQGLHFSVCPTEAPSIPFLPNFPGDECEERVGAHHVGSSPL